jgi:ComEC/Rec2-related protein
MVGQTMVWFLGAGWLALALVLVGFGFARFAVRGFSWLTGGLIVGVGSALMALDSPQVGPALQGELTVFGTIEGTPRHPRPGEVTVELRTEAELGSSVVRCRAVDLPWRNAASLQPGDAVWVRGMFTAIGKPMNPFSWEGWLWRRGVRAECKARFISQPIYRAPEKLYQWRETVKNHVLATIGESQGTGLFLSMALGYHDLLSVPLEQAFTRLGLTHLLVVSGYQVSLTFGFILSCMAVILGWIGYGNRWLRYAMTALAFASAALYVVFIGAEMSAVRALLAAACACAHLLSERETSFAQRWGVALLGMQLLWPWCAFDIGVVLTFAALFGIGLGSELTSRTKLATFIAVTCAVWLCTSLVIVVWQGTFSPLGLLLNLVVAVPWSILNGTVGLSALGLLLTGIPGFEYPLRAVGAVNQVLSEIVLSLGELGSASWKIVGVARVVLAVVVAMMICFLVYRHSRVRRVRLS